MNRADIYRINNSFLPTKLYKEFQQLGKYLDFMITQSKKPVQCHVSAELYVSWKAKTGADELVYDGVRVLPYDAKEAAKMMPKRRQSFSNIKNKSKNHTENLKKYLADHPEFK